MMEEVEVKLSPKQKSKLRNGHKVRVSPAMEGTGIKVKVSPLTRDKIMKSFRKNKGLDIQLNKDELEMNGSGILGKRFDRAVGSLIGKKARKAIYGEAEKLLPLAQAGLTAGLASGATALGALQPELIPYLPAGVAGLSAIGSDYLANPSKYQSNAGGTKASLAKDLAGRYVQNQLLSSVNSELGTNMDSLTTAGLGNALSNKARSNLIENSIQSRQSGQGLYSGDGLYSGNGLYASSAGRGLYASSERRTTGGTIGRNAGILNIEHPAMRSQPFSANFQFKHTLPPAFQKHIG
jgi:hypothetical protein